MGLEIVAVRVAALAPTSDVEKALQQPTRESIQQRADEATFARRALAVEKERAIAENELQNRIEGRAPDDHAGAADTAAGAARFKRQGGMTHVAALRSGRASNRIPGVARAPRDARAGRFFLSQRGQDIEQLERRHELQRAQHAEVLGAVPVQWRRASVERGDLDRFLFGPDDVIVVFGQDGLVANVAKYLDGQPVIGINPQPDRYPGVLVRHRAPATADLLADVQADRASVQQRTIVQAQLDDGQALIALNEIFVGACATFF